MFVDHVLSNYVLKSDYKQDCKLFGKSLYFNYAMGRLKETILIPDFKDSKTNHTFSKWYSKSVDIRNPRAVNNKVYKLPDGRELVEELNQEDALAGIESFFDQNAFARKESLFNYMHEIKTEA